MGCAAHTKTNLKRSISSLLGTRGALISGSRSVMAAVDAYGIVSYEPCMGGVPGASCPIQTLMLNAVLIS
jgi:hypothetical protein